MGKKLKLIPFLFKTLSSDSWPSCSNQPKTLSFRAASAVPNIFKTANSVFSVEESSSGGGDDDDDDEKAVLSGLRAKDRLFFEPGETSSILEHPPLPPKQRKTGAAETAEMDSMDPVMDFRRSMEEMVEAHGMKDWDGLEELLGWYLSVNGKSNHGYIVGAFVDLIIGICLSEEEEEEEELSESLLSRSCSSLLTRSDEGYDHHHHRDNDHNKSMSTTTTSTSISQSPTSALSFSSSSTSSCSILPSSLQALLEADDEDKIQNTI